MAQFNIDIPGVGKITVDGNFATEDSINRLASAMGGRTGRSSTTLNDISRYGDDVADSLHALDPALRRNTKEVDKNTKQFKTFNDGFSKVDGLFSDMADPGSGTLNKFVKSVGDATAGFGSGLLRILPGIGDGLGDLFSSSIGVFTGMITEAISFSQGLVDINKDINTAGIGFINGIEGMQEAATDAGIPFQQFAKAMVENTESLRLMAGGAPGGILNVSKAMSKLTKSTDQQFQTLLAMGYSVEDIVGTMSDLGAQAGLAGQALNPDQLAKSTTEYLKSQQELNRLTGVDIKQARERMKEQNASLFIQRQLNKINDPAQRAAANDILARVPEEIRDFVASGVNFTEASGIITSQLPLLSSGFRDLYQGIESGAITQEEVDNYLAEMLKNPALKKEMDNMVNVLGITPAELLSKLPISSFEKIRMAMESGFKAAESEVNYNQFALEGMNKSVAAMEDLLLSVNNGFSVLGFTLFSLVDGQLASAGDAAGSVIDKFTNVSDTLKDFTQARERRIQAELSNMDPQGLAKLIDAENEAKERLSKLMGGAAGSASNLLGEFVKYTQNFLGDLKTAISESMVDGFKGIATLIKEYLFPETENEKQSSEAAKAAAAFADLPALAIGGASNFMFGTDFNTTPFYDYFIRMNDKEREEYNKNSTVEQYSDPMTGFMPPDLGDMIDAPKQALGGIFNYKPGGELVTVAEAGPELVAPAKRTKEGKLGLEVSGAQLDNSQLLRNLVEINKGQADLMASLNNKFDKLVAEQRQANRLSV